MNKVILMGRLTKDPELRYTSSSNIPVCSYTIAVDRRFAKQGEESQTDFIPIVVWNKTAEFCSKYFKKGSKILLAGRLQVRTWDDTEGKRHWVTEVIADEVHFADSKRDSDMSGSAMPQKNSAPASQEGTDGFYPLDMDDELPF